MYFQAIRKLVLQNPLYFAFLFPAICDGLFTLLGQNPDFWSKHIADEMSPAYYFLVLSPWFFILGAVIWFILLYFLFKHLKKPFNLWLMLLFVVGHSWGSSSWLFKILKDKSILILHNQTSLMFSWTLLIVYFILITGITAYCLTLYQGTKKT